MDSKHRFVDSKLFALSLGSTPYMDVEENQS